MKKKTLFYWIKYFIFCGVLLLYIASYFYLNGKSLICKTDGYNQQYVSLVYYRRWLISWLSGIVHGENFMPRMFDECIGYGADAVVNVFSAIGILSPSNLLSILVPEQSLETFFAFQTLFRILLAGASFSLFSQKHIKSDYAILIGAMSYCFCGFVVQKGFQHTFFLLGVIAVPLLCWAADRIIIEHKSPLIFIIVLTGVIVSNFYFFYMSVLALICYVIIFLLLEKYNWKERGLIIARFIVYGVSSVLLSAVVLLPVIIQMRGSGRIGQSSIPLLYSVKYYCEFFFGCMTNDFRSYDCRTGYFATQIMVVFVLFLSKGNAKKKFILVIGILALCIPAIGSMMNGFGYVSNRWIYAFSFAMAYCLSWILSFDFEVCEVKGICQRLCALLILYIVVAIVVCSLGYMTFKSIRMSLLVLAVTIVVSIIFWLNGKNKVVKYWIGIVSITCIIANIYLELDPEHNNAVGGYVDRGEALAPYTTELNSNLYIEASIDNRYRSDADVDRGNSYMLQKLKGTGFYFSTVVGSINNLMQEMEYNIYLEHSYTGFDDRLILERLHGIRYYLEDDKVVEDPYSLPIAYVYSKEYPRKEYEKLTVEEKQEVMMYAGVVEEMFLPRVDYTSECVIVAEGMLDEAVRSEHLGLDIDIDQDVAESELYLIVEDVEFLPITDAETYLERWESLDETTKSIIRKALRNQEKVSTTSINVTFADSEKRISYATPSDRMYAGRNNFLCNLGVIRENVDNIHLEFEEYGDYHMKYRVVSQPLSSINVAFDKLGEEDTVNIDFEKNRIVCDVDAQREELLCVTIPYSSGWKAYVDGEKVPIKKTNTAFCGIELFPGEHHIVMEYTTPGIVIGSWISLIGLIMVIAIHFFYSTH